MPRAGLGLHVRQRPQRVRQIPETTAGGVGLLDYDSDGWLDVFAVQGGSFRPIPPGLVPAIASSETGATARSPT